MKEEGHAVKIHKYLLLMILSLIWKFYRLFLKVSLGWLLIRQSVGKKQLWCVGRGLKIERKCISWLLWILICPGSMGCRRRGRLGSLLMGMLRAGGSIWLWRILLFLKTNLGIVSLRGLMHFCRNLLIIIFCKRLLRN